MRSALLLTLAACVTPVVPATPEYSPSATAPDLRTLYDASPRIVPVSRQGAFGVTLQLALHLGFTVVHSDSLSGLLVISRTQRDDYEIDADSRGYLHTRKLTLTIAIDGRTATFSPSVVACAEASCFPFNGLIAAEVAVLKEFIGVIEPVRPAPRDTTSL